MWLGIVAGLVPLILTWPLLEAIRIYYAAGFWSKPQLDLIPQSYDMLLFLQSGLGIGFALALVLFLTSRLPRDLAGLLIFFLLSPILMTVAATLAGAGMQDRYAMVALVSAVAIATGILAARLGPQVAVGVLAIPPYRYGDDEQRDRLMVVVDPPSAQNYVNTDSVDRNLSALRQHLAVHVEDFQDFAQVHTSFLLLSPHDSNGDYFDWWARRLAFDGYTLRVQAIRNRQVLYLVER